MVSQFGLTKRGECWRGIACREVGWDPMQLKDCPRVGCGLLQIESTRLIRRNLVQMKRWGWRKDLSFSAPRMAHTGICITRRNQAMVILDGIVDLIAPYAPGQNG
jgi:hypothetical protein